MVTPFRVLVIEDDPQDAERMLEVLQRAGYDPQWLRVETAEAFTAALERSPWDVILADYALPHFSGMGALKLLQAARLDIPFLIVSGAIGEEMAVILTRAGTDGFVSKARLNRLAHAVERALRDARQRQSKRQAEKEIEVLASRWRLLLEHALVGIAVHQVIRDAQGDLAD